MPLTADRAKPAVPFGGATGSSTSCCRTSSTRGTCGSCVLTQYKSHSLDRHITTTWRMSTLLGNYVTPVPAQQRLGPRWFTGSADAIFQSLNLVYDERPTTSSCSAPTTSTAWTRAQMVEQHIERGAGVTVAGIRVPRAQADQFGVIETGPDGRTSRSSSRSPPTRRGCPTPRRGVRLDGQLRVHHRGADRGAPRRRRDEGSVHDMGGNIIPMLVDAGRAQVYDFADNEVPGATERDRGYWRDVGTIDAYYDAHMDLVSVHPVFNLYNRSWPILTTAVAAAGQVRRGRRRARVDGRRGVDRGGRHVGARVLSNDVSSTQGAYVEGSVLMPGVRDRPGRRRPAGHPRQERHRARGRADRREPDSGPRALHHERGRDRRAGQGPEGRTRLTRHPPGFTGVCTFG